METAPAERPARVRSVADRILHKFRRPSVPDLVAAAIFAVAGSLFVTGAIAGAGGDIRNDRTGELRDSIAQRADVAHSLSSDVTALSDELRVLRAASADQPKLAAIQKQAAELDPVVGLTEVTGPGVTVTLNDAVPPDPLPDDMKADDYIIHQQDIQGVVNALWRGGASGVTVMGVRLISTSAVRCVGNTVILQGRVHSPPFVITAVGDIARLQAALAQDPSVQILREWVDFVGLGYEETTFPKSTLPPHNGPTQLQYSSVQ